MRRDGPERRPGIKHARSLLVSVVVVVAGCGGGHASPAAVPAPGQADRSRVSASATQGNANRVHDADVPDDVPDESASTCQSAVLSPDLRFRIDSVELVPEGHRVLDELRSRVDTTDAERIAVEWYGFDTSERGLDVTRRRARSIRTLLVERGVSGDRIEAVGCYTTVQDRSEWGLRVHLLCPAQDHEWCDLLDARSGGASRWAGITQAPP